MRDLVGPERFFHVHLSTSIEVCRTRDRTGHYLAADRGEISSFPGVSFQSEVPHDAELTLDSSSLTPDQIAQLVLMKLSE